MSALGGSSGATRSVRCRALRGWCRALGLAVVGTALATVATAARCRDLQPTTWEITIAPRGEPGTPMILSGRVLAKDRRPLAGVTMFVYHADAKGRYAAAGDASGDPRLCGVLRTNDRGEYRIHSVWPGMEGGAQPHLHYEVWGRGVSRVASSINLERESRVVVDAPSPPNTASGARPAPPPNEKASPPDRFSYVPPAESTAARFSYLPPVESRFTAAPGGAIVLRPGKDGALRGSWDLIIGR